MSEDADDADYADDADDEDGYLAGGAGVNVRGWEQNPRWRRCQVSSPAMHLLHLFSTLM